MAPELDNGPQSPQTPEIDVWSLFVTLTYAMNVASFRGKPLQTTPLRIKAIQEAANEPAFRSLRDMAMVDPKQRATAGDMLDRLFGGEDHTTRRKQIHTTAMVIDDTQPRPSKPQIEAEKVVNTEERSREPAETAEEWPPREAAVAGRRPRPASRATEKQRAGPAVETTALGPSDQKHARVTKQDAPRLHGATRARQRRYFT
ncbi:hypothetical protein B0T10DRAFT_554135 [Thelonectria olida]|uniref:Protein kinase domain-containing protein n=1 Tax=Thelonectria olida TaxID=1576542 RepID=A0A9P9AHH4_9HYPO|nr:hypothetical protein B0T10DRAFT_554135 [Thelonectria olida]